MKEVLSLGLVAFLVAVSGGTWFGAFLAPPRRPRPASPVLVRPSTPDRSSRVKPSAPVAGDAPNVLLSDSSGSTAPTAGLLSSKVVRSSEPDSAPAVSRAKAVARILASMKPRDAAEIVARLTDDEVESLMRQLNAKQVAALFAVLPDQRAAQLSRKLLAPRHGKPRGTSP